MPRLVVSPVLVALALIVATHTVQSVSRTSWVQSQLNSFNAQLPSDKRTEKYDAMAVDFFAFYRGTAHLYYQDLGQAANLSTYGGTANTRCWLSGDGHIMNVGAFANDHGDVVFDLNDFDESVLADYQLDVWRMATSINLMLRVNGGFSSSDRSSIVDSFTESYLDNIETYSTSSAETTATLTSSNAYGKLNNFLADVESSNTRVKMLDDWTYKQTNGIRTFKPTSSNSDLAPVTSDEYTAVVNAVPTYGSSLSGGLSYSSSHFTVKSVAERLHAGIGSLGTKRFYVLIEGPSTSQDDDVILDFKAETSPSAFLNLASASISATNTATSSNPAFRVVKAYKALGYRVDDYLGWVSITLSGVASLFAVRERSPWKKSFDTTDLTSLTSATNLAEQWGTVLATAHARSDKDADSTVNPYNFDQEVYNRINGKHDKFRALVRNIIEPYALQVIDDYNSFISLRSSGGLSSTLEGSPVTNPPPAVDIVPAIVGASVGAVLLIAAAAVGIQRRRRRSSTKEDAKAAVISAFSSAVPNQAEQSASNPTFNGSS